MPKTTTEPTVIIVGAGPAGATAAYYLAKAGQDVLVLDRQRFPRDKVCGDFVGPLAIKELQEMGITNLPEFQNSNIINKAAVFMDGKGLISTAMPAFTGLTQQGRVIPRKRLDSWILNAAKKEGASVLENVLVTDFSQDDESVKIFAKDTAGNRTLKCKLLIGADGSNSLIAHKLRGYPIPTTNRIVGIRGYYENVEGTTDQADMHFATESFPGYCWLFPTGDHQANVGVGVLLETFPKCNQPKELLKQLISQDEGLKKCLGRAKLQGTLDSWPLNTYDPHLPISGDRVMLIGEAAGLVNPLNGEGIQYALLSGRWASETVLSCISSNDFSQNALSSYSKRVEYELGYGFKLSALIIQLIRNRNLNPLWLQTFEIMVARAKNDPEYASLAGGILAGLVPSSEGLNAKFMIGTLEEAFVSSGLRMVNDVVSNPASLPKNVITVMQSGVEAATNTLENPLGLLQWSMDTVAKMVEFAMATPTEILNQNTSSTRDQIKIKTS